MNVTINKNRIIYMFASIGGRFYILFTIPILTKYLSKDDFGFYIILVQIVIVVQSALLALFSNGLLKFWVDSKEEERKIFMGTIFLFFIFLAAIIILGIYINKKYIFIVFFPNVTQDINPAMLYTLLWLFAISLRSFLLAFINIIEKPKFALIHIIVYGMLLIGLLYWRLIHIGSSIDVVMFTFLIAEVLALGILMAPVIKNISLCFHFEYLKAFMKFSFPLIAASFLFIAFMNTDRLILAQYVSLEDMGVYGIGFMLGNISGMIVSANMSAYLPRVKKVMATGDELTVRKLTTYYMYEIQDLMAIVVVSIAIFSNLTIYLLANKYVGSSATIIMIGVAIGHLVRSNYLFFEQILFLKDRVKSIFFIKLLVFLFGLVLGFVLISWFGLIGASLLWAITFLVINVLAYQLIKEYNLLEINIKKTILVFILASLLWSCEYYFHNSINLSFEYFSLKLIEFLLLTILIIKYYKLYILRRIQNG